MSGCVDGPTFVEQVRLIFVDKTQNPTHKVWEGCISAYGQLSGIFQRWVDENHPGSPVGQYSFTLDSLQGQPLSGDETCKELDVHSGRKIFAIVWLG
ncbi:hypothetical protein I302_106632 [Kwoniella bestiolae CBS 10118]|uniref:Ubiquitin-like domain-containing protein n=1 Tax=Kwoniella bestiolae CBS 10118 TaxID=1296100 RepID=A0A1B9G0U5_9TREE|nr:hypothetical protein I302_06106 [Kwoniella bestiolae CBS 10118]OCF24645.1 hypothetical protein I302_06106 [Kwoniella bestiolae CBS 10118]